MSSTRNTSSPGTTIGGKHVCGWRRRSLFPPQYLENWFGKWVEDPRVRESGRRLASFKSVDNPADRLLMALHLSLAGAHYKEEGGYPEDAAREYLHVCETVCHYMKRNTTVDRAEERLEK